VDRTGAQEPRLTKGRTAAGSPRLSPAQWREDVCDGPGTQTRGSLAGGVRYPADSRAEAAKLVLQANLESGIRKEPARSVMGAADDSNSVLLRQRGAPGTGGQL